MNLLKKSFLPFALSSIVLFASVSPVECAKRAPKPVVAPVLVESIPVNSKKAPLSFKQKLRKKYKKIKNDIAEFIEEHPVATFASVVGSAIALWFFWDTIFPPWVHRERVLGPSACDVQEVVMPQGHEQEIVHNIIERHPVLDPEALARGERIWIDGEVQNRVINARFRLANPVQIVQLRAANQGLNGSCAYHATKNCMAILNELEMQRGDLQLQLEGDDQVQRFFRFNPAAENNEQPNNERHGIWRQIILRGPYLQHGHCLEGGDWLSGIAIQALIDHEFDNHDMLHGAYVRRVNVIAIPRIGPDGRPIFNDNGEQAYDNGIENHSPITIIEDANRINNPNPAIDDTRIARADLADALRNNREFRHGFIFNTARTINGAVPRRDNGHWLAAVLHCTAQGNIRWYVANSQNRSILNSPTLRELIAAVQGAPVPNRAP